MYMSKPKIICSHLWQELILFHCTQCRCQTSVETWLCPVSQKRTSTLKPSLSFAWLQCRISQRFLYTGDFRSVLRTLSLCHVKSGLEFFCLGHNSHMCFDSCDRLIIRKRGLHILVDRHFFWTRIYLSGGFIFNDSLILSPTLRAWAMAF